MSTDDLPRLAQGLTHPSTLNRVQSCEACHWGGAEHTSIQPIRLVSPTRLIACQPHQILGFINTDAPVLCAEKSFPTTVQHVHAQHFWVGFVVQQQHADHYVYCTYVDLYIYAELMSSRPSKRSSLGWHSLSLACGAGSVSGLSTAR
jgi:hypothetical protein